MVPESELPPQTPNWSTASGEGQQMPPASSSLVQQVPRKSTATPSPSQAPQASSFPSGQHSPTLSIVDPIGQQLADPGMTPACGQVINARGTLVKVGPSMGTRL